MPDPAPTRARKIRSAVFVVALAIGVFWVVEHRSQPPPPPKVALPYEPARLAGEK